MSQRIVRSPLDSKARPTGNRHRPRQARRHFEALETRALLSASSLAITGTSPDFFRGNSGVYDASGNLWIANNSIVGGEIDKVSFDSSGNPVLNPVISIPDQAPRSMVLSGGKFFFIDDNTGWIDEVDPANPTAAPVQFTINATFNGDNAAPNMLAASADGAIWWVASTTFGTPDATGVSHNDNVIGRLNPTTSNTQYYLLNTAQVGDSQSIAISPFSSNGVYIGLSGVSQTNTITNANIQGLSHIATATFNGSSVSATVYTLASTNPDDVTANQFNYLSSLATAPDGSAWFSLANAANSPLRAGQVADRLVHGTIAGATMTETSYVIPGSSATSRLNLGPIAMDGSGRLWFVTQGNNQVGFLDTTNLGSTTDRFTMDAFPDGPDGPTTNVTSIFTDSHAGNTLAWVTTESAGYSLMKVDAMTVTTDTPLTVVGSSFTALPLRFALTTVTFTDDTTSSISWFTATINWGNGATTKGLIVADPTTPGRYYVAGLYHYAKRGTYTITVTITTTEPDASIVSNVATGTIVVR